MIFNIGENPHWDVIRMLMHYTEQQKKIEETNYRLRKNVVQQPAAVITSSDISDSTSVTSTSSSKDGARRLHVTNLPFKIKDNELKAMFQVHGSVIDAEIIYNERGSKGFGFVTMETSEEAAIAKEALDGKELEGRKIQVNNATPRSSQNKVGLNQLKSRIPMQTLSSQATNLICGRQPITVPNLSPTWNTTNMTCLNTSSIPTNHIQFALPPPHHQHIANAPAFSITPTHNTTHMPGITCYPTPEQYAQYYHYISTHGPFRATYPPTNGTITNYRYQPY